MTSNAGILLTDLDEYTHRVGPAGNWNESRYIDFWDGANRIGGWFRIGNRPNERHAEMSACINIPDGRTAFMFARPEISHNELYAAGQHWHIDEPWRRTRVTYHGEMIVLEDPWQLVEPKRAFHESPRVAVAVELDCLSEGLGSVMGFDQGHIDRIFLPGQADFHYQHLIHSTGRVTVGPQDWIVDGRGAKDHSWGPRNWHAKIYLRWLIASFDDDHGFILVRAVGPTKTTRSGFVWDAGKFHLVDDFDMRNEYADAPHYELKRTTLKIRSGSRAWKAEGIPQAWLPLRHRQNDAAGKPALLRIVKSPTQWTTDEGRTGPGMCEYHDLMIEGRPAGIED
jgi:hypothetical protein